MKSKLYLPPISLNVSTSVELAPTAFKRAQAESIFEKYTNLFQSYVPDNNTLAERASTFEGNIKALKAKIQPMTNTD